MKPEAVALVVAVRAKLARRAALSQTAIAPSQEEPEQSRHVMRHGAAGVGGVAAISKSKPLATGRETLYHGTHQAAVPAIQAGGLKPRSAVGGHGITDVLPDAVREEGKRYAYMTPSKMEARSYAAQADAIQSAKGNIVEARMNMALDPKSQARILNPFSNKGVVKAEVPVWKLRQQGRIVANPELEGLGRKEWVDRMVSRARRNPFAAPPNRMMGNIAYKSLEQARVIRDGVGPEHIVGNSKFQRLGMRELGEYVRAHPGRFAGGVGLGALGLAGVGYAASGLLPRHKEAAAMGEEHGLANARLLLKVASEKNLAVPLGKALRKGWEGAKYLNHQAGRVGAGIAEGLGTGEEGQRIGRRAAQLAAAGAGTVGAQKGKRKVDEFRYRHGLYAGM